MEVSQYTEVAAAFTCLALLAGMMIAFTLGRRAGIKHHQVDPEGARTVSGAVEASVFGLLGLLIAFTFYGASDRFEARRTLITEEANAIDNAWRNLDLLANADRDALHAEFRDYLDARLSYYAKLPNEAAAAPEFQRAQLIESAIWQHAIDAVSRATILGTTVVLLPSLSRMFEVATMREMALKTHPPIAIYGLLICLALICASLAGHHASPSAKHPLIVPLMFAGISALAIFVILDLEYPRAGFIRIDAADALLREVRAHMG
jgi:hypothetical protein